MAATERGPVSICLHNAMWDIFILEPVPVHSPESSGHSSGR